MVYIFTIEEADGVITKQYYIVKDHVYCLDHVTNFSGTEDVFEVAQGIADSFVWADDSQNEERFSSKNRSCGRNKRYDGNRCRTKTAI